MKLQVHIGHHFYGAGNFGDDLMMAGFLKAIGSLYPRIHFTCSIPNNIFSQRLRFPQIEWFEYDNMIRENCVRNCDFWLGLGDTPFQTDVGLWFVNHLIDELTLCQRFKKPMYFLGVGVNNSDALENIHLKSVLKYSTHIWTRDDKSAELIKQICIVDKISVGADLAHIYLEEYRFNDIDKRNLGYVLNFENRKLWNPQVFFGLLNIYKDYNHRWLIQEVRTLPGSEMELFSEMEEHKNLIKLYSPNYNNFTVGEYLSGFGSPEILITSRYHSAVIGAWAGSKLVILKRNMKLEGLCKQIRYFGLDSLSSVEKAAQAVKDSKSISKDTLLYLAKVAKKSCIEFMDRVYI